MEEKRSEQYKKYKIEFQKHKNESIKIKNVAPKESKNILNKKVYLFSEEEYQTYFEEFEKIKKYIQFFIEHGDFMQSTFELLLEQFSVLQQENRMLNEQIRQFEEVKRNYEERLSQKENKVNSLQTLIERKQETIRGIRENYQVLQKKYDALFVDPLAQASKNPIDYHVDSRRLTTPNPRNQEIKNASPNLPKSEKSVYENTTPEEEKLRSQLARQKQAPFIKKHSSPQENGFTYEPNSIDREEKFDAKRRGNLSNNKVEREPEPVENSDSKNEKIEEAKPEKKPFLLENIPNSDKTIFVWIEFHNTNIFYHSIREMRIINLKNEVLFHQKFIQIQNGEEVYTFEKYSEEIEKILSQTINFVSFQTSEKLKYLFGNFVANTELKYFDLLKLYQKIEQDYVSNDVLLCQKNYNSNVDILDRSIENKTEAVRQIFIKLYQKIKNENKFFQNAALPNYHEMMKEWHLEDIQK